MKDLGAILVILLLIPIQTVLFVIRLGLHISEHFGTSDDQEPSLSTI